MEHSTLAQQQDSRTLGSLLVPEAALIDPLQTMHFVVEVPQQSALLIIQGFPATATLGDALGWTPLWTWDNSGREARPTMITGPRASVQGEWMV